MWKRMGATGGPQRPSGRLLLSSLMAAYRRPPPAFALSSEQQEEAPRIPCRDLCLWFGRRSAKLWCGPTELFSLERARFQPWQKGCGAAHAVAPHHAFQEVNKLQGLGEAVGSPLTPNTSLSCPYNEGWAQAWDQVSRRSGRKWEVPARCFPAGSGNSLCLCPSALRSKPPWIIQVLFEISQHAEGEGSLALPAGKQALIVSSRTKRRFSAAHNGSTFCHLWQEFVLSVTSGSHIQA